MILVGVSSPAWRRHPGDCISAEPPSQVGCEVRRSGPNGLKLTPMRASRDRLPCATLLTRISHKLKWKSPLANRFDEIVAENLGERWFFFLRR